MSKFTSITFLVVLANIAFAQDSQSVKMLVPNRAIKISPLHVVNFYPTVEISYEQKVAPSATVQVELGYVIDMQYIGRDKIDLRINAESKRS